jgi:hypothetical protein
MYSDGYSIYMILLDHLYIIKKFQDAEDPQFIHPQARFLPTQGSHSQVIHKNENVSKGLAMTGHRWKLRAIGNLAVWSYALLDAMMKNPPRRRDNEASPSMNLYSICFNGSGNTHHTKSCIPD